MAALNDADDTILKLKERLAGSTAVPFAANFADILKHRCQFVTQMKEATEGTASTLDNVLNTNIELKSLDALLQIFDVSFDSFEAKGKPMHI